MSSEVETCWLGVRERVSTEFILSDAAGGVEGLDTSGVGVDDAVALPDIRRVADDHTQRIRIGITGLAAVLLVVLFAAAVVGFRTRDAGQGDNAAVLNNDVAAVEAPKDPLAELGVAPGGQPAATESAPPPKPAPPAR